jgi:hypothetical protein
VLQLGQDQFNAEKMIRCGVSNSSMLYVVEKPDRGRKSG